MTARAVSVTLNYVILLAVATTVLVGMSLVVGSVLDSQMNHAIQDELTVTGESLATEIEQADRLYRSSDENATRLVIQKELRTHVSDRTYRIAVDGSEQQVTLRTTRPATSISVPFNASSLGDETWEFSGGPVEIRLDEESDALEVGAA